MSVLEAGHAFGVAVCVNDGDSGVNGEDVGEGGQKGWSGWGPYAIVYAKTPSQAGLVRADLICPARAPGAIVILSTVTRVRVPRQNENCTGLAQIARLGPTLWLKIPIRALKLAHNLGQPCAMFVQ